MKINICIQKLRLLIPFCHLINSHLKQYYGTTEKNIRNFKMTRKLLRKTSIPIRKSKYRNDNQSEDLPGYPAQSSSTGVLIFFSEILSYFCRFVAAFKPCQGKVPRLKYISTYPSDSISSLRLCSTKNYNVNVILLSLFKYSLTTLPLILLLLSRFK